MNNLPSLNILNLNNLCFEVTRKCTQQCKHCMRGPMQDVDIDKTVIDAFFNQLKSYDNIFIDQLSFSGGEPLLNVEAMNYILDKIEASNFKIKIDHFNMVTNGMVYNKEVESTLYRLYELSQTKEKCMLGCSLDQFHIQPSESNLESFSKMPFSTKIENYELEKSEILNTGLARKNNLGYPMNTLSIDTLTEPIHYTIRRRKQNDILMLVTSVDSIIYINSKGYILSFPDGNYVIHDKHNFGNVLIDNLFSNMNHPYLKKRPKIRKKQKTFH